MNKKFFIVGISYLTLFPLFVFGQLLDPVEYFLIDSPDTVQAGEVFNISIKAEIDDNWHLYSISNDPDAGPFPTQFSSSSSNMKIAGKIKESEPEIAFDPNFQTDLGWHSSSAEFQLPVAFKSNLQGIQEISIEVLYQVCDDRSCLPPKTKQIKGDVVLAGVSDLPFQAFQKNNDDTSSISAHANDSENSTDATTDDIVEYFWLIISLFLSVGIIYILFRKK